MDIISNPSGFVNFLLVNNDIRTIQFSLQNCLILINEITTLEHVIEKLYYSVHAELYKDSLNFANDCKKKFDIFKNEINNNYIKNLYTKFNDILQLIKKKLLNNFDIQKEDSSNNQIDQIIELLGVLNNEDKDIFLKELSEKVCNNLPKDNFSLNYTVLLKWVFPVLTDNKYVMLKKWNINKYIIECWAKKINEKILAEDYKNLDVKMLRAIRITEKKIKEYDPDYQEILSIAFDTFCKNKLKEAFSKYNIPIINNVMENDLLKCSTELIFTLKNYELIVKEYLNNRNIVLLLEFYSNKITTFLNQLTEFIKNNSDELFNITFIECINKTVDYLRNNINEIKSKYNNFDQEKKIELFKKNFEQILFLKYKEKIISLIDQSVNKFYNNIIKSITKGTENFIGNILNVQQDKDNFLSEEPSKEIIEVCQLLLKFKENESIILYLMTELNNIYKDKLIPDTLLKYNKNIIRRILYDLIHLKNQLKNFSQILSETENKVKFLNCDILDNKLYVEQYKMFYKDHNKDNLKKILKFKNVEQGTINNIIKFYDIKN